MIALQKVVFRFAKGGILAAKTPPFATQKVAFWIVSRRCLFAYNIKIKK
jgi:hypothetical protein